MSDELEAAKELALSLSKAVEEMDRTLRRLITQRDKAYVRLSNLKNKNCTCKCSNQGIH